MNNTLKAIAMWCTLMRSNMYWPTYHFGIPAFWELLNGREQWPILPGKYKLRSFLKDVL